MKSYSFPTNAIKEETLMSGTERGLPYAPAYKVIMFIITFLVLQAFCPINAQEKNSVFNNLNKEGVILDGYDPVAFFTDQKPVRGDAHFQYRYENALYYFSSEEHLNLFKSDPEKYKPQFGGWCAYAVSFGHVAPIDVNTFSFVNGRLVLQHNKNALKGWSKDPENNLMKADKYWPDVAKNQGKQIKTN